MTSEGPQWLRVGYVARVHGLRGTLVVKTFDPSSTALGEVERVQLSVDSAPRIYSVVDVREGPGGALLVDIKDLHTRNEADLLVGASVAVHRDELEPPEEGEFFLGDLIGLSAVTPEDAPLGTVSDVWASGPVPNLVLTQGSEELLVPFADEFVVKIDLEGRTIVIAPPRYSEESE